MTPITRILEAVGLLFAGLAWAGLIALVAVGVGMCSGCGGASPEQRESYAVEVARCVAAERAIVDRESTAEQDEIDLAILRAECDRHLEEIEQ